MADEASPRKPLRSASLAGETHGEEAAAAAKHVLSWLSSIAFAFLVHNTAAVVCRSARSAWAVAAAYVDVVCLFWCISTAERRSGKEKLKAAVWASAMVLTALLPYVVAAPAEGPAMAMALGFKAKQLGRKFLLPQA